MESEQAESDQALRNDRLQAEERRQIYAYWRAVLPHSECQVTVGPSSS